MENAVIVDVRNPDEYATGHAPGSINIPLPQLAQRLGELDPSRQVIVCCASGKRSAMGQKVLQEAGFSTTVDGGSWQNLV